MYAYVYIEQLYIVLNDILSLFLHLIDIRLKN